MVTLHQQGQIPANAFVLNLDAVERNAQVLATEAHKYGLKTFAMPKQVGRHSGFCQAAMRGGIDRSVAVDLACAIACDRAGLKTGHLGHLVQIPRQEAAFATLLQLDYWTVFSDVKAQEAAAASIKANRNQALMARIQAVDDIFYRGHEGGFDAGSIVAVAERIDALNGVHFAGITTFPTLL